MDKDRAQGAGKQQKGKLKEKAGEWTGDQKMRAEGKTDKAKGKAQSAVGAAKEKMKW